MKILCLILLFFITTIYNNRISVADDSPLRNATISTEELKSTWRNSQREATIHDTNPARIFIKNLNPDSHGFIALDERFLKNINILSESMTTQIYLGVPADDRQAGDVVALSGSRKFKLPICSGVALNRNTVLTAAHCICDKAASWVYVGDSIGNSTPFMVEHMNPYSALDHSNNERCKNSAFRGGDLAILKVNGNLKTSIRRIAETDKINTATHIMAAGFGIDTRENFGVRNWVNVIMVSPNCNGTTQNEHDSKYYECLTNREMVGGQINFRGFGPGPCHGDSGGPAMVKAINGEYELAGIISRPVNRNNRRDCGDGAIYVRIDSNDVQSWIQAGLQ